MAGQTYSKNQFGEASISRPLPIGGAAGPLMILPTGEKIFNGNGAPTALTAPAGSLYLRGDGANVNQFIYINTDGGTTWAAAALGQAAVQADSVAASLPAMVTDFNALLAKLKAAGLMASA